MNGKTKVLIGVILTIVLLAGLNMLFAQIHQTQITQQDIKPMQQQDSKSEPLCSRIATNATPQQIKAEFNSIFKSPYNIKTNNCTTKTRAFAQYLLNHGVDAQFLAITDVYPYQDNVGTLTKNKKGYLMVVGTAHLCGHEYLVWDGSVYDPTSNIFNMSQGEYQSKVLNPNGFNGLHVSKNYYIGFKL